MLAKHEEEVDLVEDMLATEFFAYRVPFTPFGQKARDKYKSTLTTYWGLGVEGYAILLNALNRCSDPEDRECLNNQIRSTTNFIGIMSKITITPNGKAQRPLFINSIQDGQSKFIVKVY